MVGTGVRPPPPLIFDPSSFWPPYSNFANLPVKPFVYSNLCISQKGYSYTIDTVLNLHF